ncbi:unnamed protein product [Gongylonema pulchrum]|uniref:Secreted protein n=1 Tax=Gongylonema pulchrum TaxID=637853 RepID=A0A183DV71_9BILA|nr:unnamed protein product [Gongylonema pulchrum]
MIVAIFSSATCDISDSTRCPVPPPQLAGDEDEDAAVSDIAALIEGTSAAPPETRKLTHSQTTMTKISLQ